MTADRQQTRLLAKTFFARMFESDLMPPGFPQVQLVIWVIAFLAAPAVAMPILLVKKYIRAGFIGPDAVRAAMSQDRAMALLLSMVATAMVTLVLWENIFPDRRDSRHLGVLPIRTLAFVRGRLAAICTVFALVFLAPTAISSIMFGFTGSFFGMPGGFGWIALGHFLASAGAEAVVFFGIILLQCTLLNLAGPSIAQRLAVVLQVVFIVMLFQMPLLLPPQQSFAATAGGAPGWAFTAAGSALPPLWFLSLFEHVAAGGFAETQGFAAAAAALAVGIPVAAVLMYAASYRRLTRLAIEGRPVPARRTESFAARAVATLIGLVTGTAAARAVCGFTLRTLVRSRQHRMLFAGWIGLALASIISAILPTAVRLGAFAFDRPRMPTLATPLILAALSLTGARMLFAVPVEIKANWTFRLREPIRIADAVNGASAALMILGVVPAVLLALGSGTALWGLRAGAQHAAFCALMSIALVQVLMRGVDKVPFTCTYFPGKAQIAKFWPLYLSVFSLFTYTAAYVEIALLRSPGAYAAIAAILLLAIALLAWRRRRDSAQLVNLRFEEEPLDALTLVSL